MKYISKKWDKLTWYKKLLLVTSGTVVVLSPAVIVPVSMGVEYAYSWFVQAVVAFESILGGLLGSVEQLSFGYIGYVAAIALVPMTVGITAHVIDNKKPVVEGSKDGMEYESR